MAAVAERLTSRDQGGHPTLSQLGERRGRIAGCPGTPEGPRDRQLVATSAPFPNQAGADREPGSDRRDCPGLFPGVKGIRKDSGSTVGPQPGSAGWAGTLLSGDERG